MAHDRARNVLSLYQKMIRASPILGIFGHRQVGKTTFMSSVSSQYLTFDTQKERSRAQTDPDAFVASLKKHPYGIDECQMVPDLFPALKEWVRIKKQPGQFILSGSVRFTSRKAIRESLAGRMMFFEMYPLILSEIDQRPLPDFFLECVLLPTFNENQMAELSSAEKNKRLKSLEHYLIRGGLPGICFLREERLRSERLNDLHRLMLDRDLRLVHETKISIEKLIAYLGLIAQSNLKGYSYTQVKKELSLSPVTQKALLYALEAIFLIRKIPIYGGSKGEIILFEDQYEEFSLCNHNMPLADQLLTLIYRNLRAQFQYRMGEPFQILSYWTKNNARVPLVLKYRNHVLGVMTTTEVNPSLSQLRAADSLLRFEQNSKVAIFSTHATRTKVISSRIAVIPIVNAI